MCWMLFLDCHSTLEAGEEGTGVLGQLNTLELDSTPA